MGEGPEGSQSVDIDWNDYHFFDNEWGETFLEHDVQGCRVRMELVWRDVQSAIDAAKEHHEVCILR